MKLLNEGAQTQSDFTPGKLKYWDTFYTEQVLILVMKTVIN